LGLYGLGVDAARRRIWLEQRWFGRRRRCVTASTWDPASQHPEPVDVETAALDEADDGYDPIEFAEQDDEFDLAYSLAPLHRVSTGYR